MNRWAAHRKKWCCTTDNRWPIAHPLSLSVVTTDNQSPTCHHLVVGVGALCTTVISWTKLAEDFF